MRLECTRNLSPSNLYKYNVNGTSETIRKVPDGSHKQKLERESMMNLIFRMEEDLKEIITDECTFAKRIVQVSVCPFFQSLEARTIT